MFDDEKKKVHNEIKQEIRSLLISSPKTKYGGLTGSKLYFDYKELNYGKEIPYAELGFHSFLSLLRSMPDVVTIEYKENSSSYRVHPVYDQSTAHIQKMVLQQRDKYKQQNQLFNQNWHSDRQTSINFSNNNVEYPFSKTCVLSNKLNNIQTNFSSIKNRFHNKVNKLVERSFGQKNLKMNQRKSEYSLDDYFLFKERIDQRKEDQKIISLTSFSSTSFNNHQNSSTPNTFIETPTNFHIDEYYFDQSMKFIETDTNEQNNHHIEQSADDPLLSISINNKSNHLLNFEEDEAYNNSIKSPRDKKKIVSSINNEKCSSDETELIDDILHSDQDEQLKMIENENLFKRLNKAIVQCIDFCYIYRLCEIQFQYRHYPLTNQTLERIKELEQLALNQYEQEFENFEKSSELNLTIDYQKCQNMFEQYISLQRKYYYMIKLINKNKR